MSDREINKASQTKTKESIIDNVIFRAKNAINSIETNIYNEQLSFTVKSKLFF